MPLRLSTDKLDASRLSTAHETAALTAISTHELSDPPPIETTIPNEPTSNHRLSPFEISLNSYESTFTNPSDMRYAIHKQMAEDIKKNQHPSHNPSDTFKTYKMMFEITKLQHKLPGSTTQDIGIYIRHIINAYYLPLIPYKVTVHYSVNRDKYLEVDFIFKNGDISQFHILMPLIYNKIHDWMLEDMHPDQNVHLTIYASRPLVSFPQSHNFKLTIEFRQDPEIVKQWIKNYPERARKITPAVRIYIYEDRDDNKRMYIDFYQESSGKRKCFDLLCRSLSEYIRKKIPTSGGKTIRKRRVRHRQTIKKRMRR